MAEESAGHSEEMQRSGAARFAPVTGTTEPAPEADSANPSEGGATQPTPPTTAPVAPSASSVPSVASSSSERRGSFAGNDGDAFVTAYAAEPDFILSDVEGSTSGVDEGDASLPSVASKTEEMDRGTVPNDGKGRGIINDGEESMPTTQIGAQDEDNMERETGMQGLEGMEHEQTEGGIEGGIEDYDADEARVNIKALIAQLDVDGEGKVKVEDLRATMRKAASVTVQGPGPIPRKRVRFFSVSFGASDDEASAGEGVADSRTTSQRNDWTKQRNGQIPNDVEVGAVHVDEQAPQLNRRFYRGLDRPSRRAARRRRRGRGADNANTGGGPVVRQGSDADNDRAHRRTRLSAFAPDFLATASVRARRTTGLSAFVPGFLVTATLVEENEGEVVVAERVSFFERKWKGVALGIVIFLVILVVSLSVMLTKEVNSEEDSGLMTPRSDVPSMQPSSPPSSDPRPTLEIVQTRGNLRCGLRKYTVDFGEGLNVDLCRAIAAVLFGNPNNIALVPVSSSTAFQCLSEKTIDILTSGVTRTVEREVRERSTGTGLTFSSTYYYGGMAYFGDKAHVRCAEELKRHNECTSLRICAYRGSTGYDYVQSSFPSDFYEVVTSEMESKDMLLNDTCNVLAGDRTSFKEIQSHVSTFNTNFTLGDKLMTKEPLAIVTRNDDAEFSDIINWVVQSLFYGEEQGLTRDPSQCQSYPNLTGDVSDLIFPNAFYCVGNYGQILGAHYKINRGMNQINSGNTGMLYAFPFGELERNGGVTGDAEAIGDDTLLGRIRNKGSLNCGVVAPEGFMGEVVTSKELVGMNVDYCRTLAAALFNGKGEAVNITILPGKENNSFIALDNGTIDVLAGARVERKLDFRSSSPLLGGFHFSTPYYYGNETAVDDVSFFSLATRDDNVLFSSFVNCVVVATIFAAEHINKQGSIQIPLVSIFGSEFNLALKDAIAYSGSHDEIYTKNFGDVADEDRGRNSLNDEGTPQVHSFPGIREW